MTGTESILIVDDDPRLCRTLARYFTQEGYTTHTALSGEEMRRRLDAQLPDLIILDLMLPDGDGFSLARELRASYNLPIIILTGKSDTIDKVVGLEIGADDYVTKPFDERELLARVRSVLRRAGETGGDKNGQSGGVVLFEGWRLDLDSYELTSPDGEPVNLTSHEFQLLSALVRHANRVLSREAILEIVADRDWTPDDRSVDVLVGKLRKKIEKNPREPQLIETVRTVGYKFKKKVSFD